MASFNLVDLNALQIYGLLGNTIVPRPIALVSSCSPDGTNNLSPFSFFTVASANPPVLMISVSNPLGKPTKDTLANATSTGALVINLVDEDILDQSHLSSGPYPSDVDEFAVSGLTAVQSTLGVAPRVVEAKVSFECSLLQVVRFGDDVGAGNVVFCRPLVVHLADDLVGDGVSVDPIRLRPVSRLGDAYYARVTEDALITSSPNRAKQVVGFDGLPDGVRKLGLSTAELAQLAAARRIPDTGEVAEFAIRTKLSSATSSELVRLARSHLQRSDVHGAWLHVLAAASASLRQGIR